MQYSNFFCNIFHHQNILIFSLVLFCFVELGANVLHAVAKEAMTWEKDGHRIISKVETCDASYSMKYLHRKHNFSMKLKKLKHPSTR
jgi:hypothetical protein